MPLRALTPRKEPDMTVRDYLVSLVRTVIPVLTGLLLALAARIGLDIDETNLAQLIDALIIGAWYALVRWAESRWSWVGILLGWKASPTYEATTRS